MGRFSTLLAFFAGNYYRPPVNSPGKDQWRGIRNYTHYNICHVIIHPYLTSKAFEVKIWINNYISTLTWIWSLIHALIVMLCKVLYNGQKGLWVQMTPYLYLAQLHLRKDMVVSVTLRIFHMDLYWCIDKQLGLLLSCVTMVKICCLYITVHTCVCCVLYIYICIYKYR